MNKKIRDYGVIIGDFKTGKRNTIADVKGVLVGHKTLDQGDIKTGITAVLPHGGNLFKNKVVSSSHIIHGFGKSIGLEQLEEMGTIESPILLTNTLNVGVAHEAVVEYMLEDNPDIGRTTGSVNPVVGECNDYILNDLRAMGVTKDDVKDAIKDGKSDFLQGSIGAGRGMVSFGLKGGIGSSSRIVKLNQKDYVIGILVLSNFGVLSDLLVNKIPVGKMIIEKISKKPIEEEDKGSIIIVLATDIPLIPFQIKRLLKRTQSGIARTGAFHGIGSGEAAIGFSTANPIPHYSDSPLSNLISLRDDKMDILFKATIEATEESIINSLVCSNTTIGREKKEIKSLKDYIDKLDFF